MSEKNLGAPCAPAARSWFRAPATFVLTLCLPIFLGLFFVPGLRAQDQSQPATQPSSTTQQTAPATAQQGQLQNRQLQTRRAQSRQRRIQQIVNDTYGHKYEVSAGGTYMRFRPGPNLHNAGMGGWVLGFTDYLTPRFGIVGDVRGYYGSSSISVNNPYNIHNASFSVFTFMAGPQYRFYGQQHFSISGALQAGAVYGYFDADTNGFAPQLVGLYPAGITPGGMASLHLDYNLSPALAIRISPHVLFDEFGSSLDHNQGVLFGLVYRLGRH
ncbi:MAG TPA: hypothetical protein VHX63_04795 [Acidobacteriaceae bacterium]|nr:hypothetical protein [Acidobacteriaceae bacterium]